MKPSEIFLRASLPHSIRSFFSSFSRPKKVEVEMTQSSSSHFSCHKAHTHTLHKLHYGYNFWNFFDTMVIFEIKSGTFSKRGSGLILNFWSSSQLKLATNLFLNTTFFEHTLTKTQDFLSFLVFRIGGPLCMLLYDALKFGRMYL